MLCHFRWSIGHRQLVSIQLCPALPPPSSFSCTWNPLSTFHSRAPASMCSSVALFLCGLLLSTAVLAWQCCHHSFFLSFGYTLIVNSTASLRFNFQCSKFFLVCNQPPRSTQPGHPFVGRRYEYQPELILCTQGVKAMCLVFGIRLLHGTLCHIMFMK